MIGASIDHCIPVEPDQSCTGAQCVFDLCQRRLLLRQNLLQSRGQGRPGHHLIGLNLTKKGELTTTKGTSVDKILDWILSRDQKPGANTINTFSLK